MKTVIKSPAQCTPSELDTFVKMASESGQVHLDGLRSRIEQAERLIFIIKDDTCIAIAGVKNPAATYKIRIFEAAGVEEKITDYTYEIGYIYTSIKGRGVGNLLMQGVTKATPDAITFATTRSSNSAMQYLLPEFGFAKLGSSYLKTPLKEGEDDYYLDLFGKT